MLKLEALSRLERNARRMGEIVGVLAKYGLADWLSALKFDWVQERLRTTDGQAIKELRIEERLRRALTELGATFIKLGQVLSTRPDLVGPEMATELSELQSNAAADAATQVRALIQAELGRPPEYLFASFDDTPLASASIAQVHRATLHDGRAVVVKVQHADIEPRVAADLAILEGLAEFAEKHAPILRPYQPVAVTRQFHRTLLRELDFRRERQNLEDFARNFAGDATVRFPTTYRDYCSKRVLTMDFLDGVSGSEPAKLSQTGVNLGEFARRGANLYLNMIFRDGFYHADPHPGNLMVLPGGVVGVLDCGMTGRIDEPLRDEFESLLLSAMASDAGGLADVVLRLGACPADCPRDRLRADLNDFVADHLGHSLRDLDLSAALNQLVGIIQRYHIVLPARLSLLLKTLVELEGTARLFAPAFSLAEVSESHCLQAMRRRYSPKQLFSRMQRSLRNWERFVGMLPRDLAELLDRMRAGTFVVRLDHRHLDPIINRLVLGVIVAALIIGASALWSRDARPVIAGVPVLGALGFGLATYLGYRLSRAIKKSGDVDSKD
jgi:ubiquinone biosynthesis protein